MALGANEMKMPGMAVRGFVARSALSEVDLARDVRVDHPLERSIDRGATDTRFIATDDVEQIVGAEVAVLTQKNAEDTVALAGALAASRTKTGIIGEGTVHQVNLVNG